MSDDVSDSVPGLLASGLSSGDSCLMQVMRCIHAYSSGLNRGSVDTHVIWISGSVLSRIFFVLGWAALSPPSFSPALDAEVKAFVKSVNRLVRTTLFIFFLARLFCSTEKSYDDDRLFGYELSS